MDTIKGIALLLYIMAPITIISTAVVIIIYYIGKVIYTWTTKKKVPDLGFWGNFFMAVSIAFTVFSFFTAGIAFLYLYSGIIISYFLFKFLYPKVTKKRFPQIINFWKYYAIALFVCYIMFFLIIYIIFDN